MRPEAQHAKPLVGIPNPVGTRQTSMEDICPIHLHLASVCSSFLWFVSVAFAFSSITPSHQSFSPKASMLPIDGVEVPLPVHEIEAELQKQEEHEGSCSSMFCFLQQGLLHLACPQWARLSAISIPWANRTARTVSGTGSRCTSFVRCGAVGRDRRPA